MKKTFRLEGLCCANCAAKIENAISKLTGVKSVSLSFMTTRLVIETDEENLSAIVEESRKIIKKIEPDVKMV